MDGNITNPKTEFYKPLDIYMTSDERKSVNIRFDALLEECEKESSQISAHPNVGIKKDPRKLKEYVWNMLKLESEIFGMREYIKKLYREDILLHRLIQEKTQELEEQRKTAEAEIDKIIDDKRKEQRELAAFRRYGTPLPEERADEYRRLMEQMPDRVEKPKEPTYMHIVTLGPFTISRQVCREYHEGWIDKKEYNKMICKYVEDLFRYEKWERKAKAFIMNTRASGVEKVLQYQQERKAALKQEMSIDQDLTQRKKIITEKISQAQTLLKDMYNCRANLYSYDVIYKKYRSLIPLATMYEYLDSGRCRYLEGAHGAYNLYERELRMHMIYDRLDDIRYNLVNIYDTQRLLYDELQTLNRSMSEAEQHLYWIERDTNAIKGSAKEIGFYTSCKADMFDHWSYHKALKNGTV